MIVYGAMTETSIGRLFAAGIIPGILLAGAFMIWILVYTLVRPSAGGTREPARRLGERLRLLIDLVRRSSSLCWSWAAFISIRHGNRGRCVRRNRRLLLAVLNRQLTVRMLQECFKSTARTTSMVLLVVVAGSF